MEERKYRFECSCGCGSHIEFSLQMISKDKPLSMEVCMVRDGKLYFLHKLRNAISYLFKKNDLVINDIYLNEANVKKLKRFLEDLRIF
jgi:hypothetical protein